MKKLLAALLISATAFAAPASATILTYTLQNVAFDDGATASGSFGWDTGTSKLAALNISTTAGTLSAFTYNNVTSSNDYTNWFGPNSILLVPGDNVTRYLNLRFDSSLATAGVHNLLLTGPSSGSWECDNCGALRNVVSGYITSDAIDTPEPAMLGLFGLGTLGLALGRRRKA